MARLAWKASQGEGAVDLNVRPRRANVFVDGEVKGVARALDGNPDFLWLKEGEHEITLEHAGHSETHRVVVKAGDVQRLKVRFPKALASGAPSRAVAERSADVQEDGPGY